MPWPSDRAVIACYCQVDTAAGVDAVVEAVGPATVAFAAGGAPTQRVGTLEAAGAYLLHVRLGGVPVPGWPRVLHVLPAPADSARWIRGSLFAGLAVRRAWHSAARSDSTTASNCGLQLGSAGPPALYLARERLAVR